MADTADLQGHLPEAVDTVLLPERLLKVVVATVPLLKVEAVVAMAHLPVVPRRAVAAVVMARLLKVEAVAVVMVRLPKGVAAEHLRLLAAMARPLRRVATARHKVARWFPQEWARWLRPELQAP